MPELPEVETIRKQMESELPGEIIMGVEVVRGNKCFVGDANIVIGKRITGIGRQGKYLFVYFDDESGLQIHLKMTGRLVLEQKNRNIECRELNYARADHTRIVIEFASGRKLYYWDTRMFGYLRTELNIVEAEKTIKQKLGADPWEITENELMRKLQKTGRTIKYTILDQAIISGVGNIYANDGLFLAGIDPRRKAVSIGVKEVKRLLESLRSVMEKGLLTSGASDNTYRDFYGKSGSYQNEFLVYGKTKGECPQCARPLLYTKIGGRGSWICENCQN